MIYLLVMTLIWLPGPTPMQIAQSVVDSPEAAAIMLYVSNQAVESPLQVWVGVLYKIDLEKQPITPIPKLDFYCPEADEVLPGEQTFLYQGL
jgi:hypothetical protein